jgi:SET domain-containing protein
VASDIAQESSGTAIAGRGLEVKQSRHGRGVFATRRFATGETVEVCPTLRVSDADVAGRLADYVFGSGEGDDVLLLLGFGMLYNHSAEPNVDYVQEAVDAIAFVAIRAVAPGDELTIDYGEEWWDTRGLQPD